MPDENHQNLYLKNKNIWQRLNEINPVIAIAISIVCVVLIQGTMSPQPFDDAFITYRYARNLSTGLGFVYNQGEKVLGTTTPIYTILLTIIARIFTPDILPRASFVISIMADALNMWLVYRISGWILNDHSISILAAIVYLLQPFRLNVAGGGMETSLFITCLLLMYERYFVGDRSIISAFLAAGAILIRPDAVIALVPLYVDWIIHDWRGAIKGAVITLITCLPWIIWATAYFGSPIPQSIIAKSITYKNSLGQAAFYLLTFLGTGTIGPYTSPIFLLPGLFIVLPIAVIGIIDLSKHNPRGLVICSYPLIYIVLMSIINPSMYFSWYFVPLIPGLLINLFASIWYRPKLSKKYKFIAASFLSILLVIVPVYLLNTKPSWPLSRSREIAFWDASKSISEHNLKNKVVLAPDIGVIGWSLADASILDPIGLVSPEAIIYSTDLPPDQLVSPEMIKDKRPDYIISLDQFINPAVIDDEYFQKSYTSVYEMNVEIVNTNQSLYVFQLNRNH